MIRFIRIIILIMFCLPYNKVEAQHLEFMGIPLNGTIASFQAKLLKKGCRLVKFNAQLPSGMRGFTGTFAGNDANICVFYTPSTKKVYGAKVAIDCGESRQSANDTFDFYKDLLNQKYEDHALTSDMIEEHPAPYEYTLMVVKPPVEPDALLLGSISMSIQEYDGYPTTYGIVIEYEDATNSSANESTNLQDL